MSQDTDDTIYTVGFSDEGFLMVYNPKRKGWEMPGGHVREGEDREDAAVREFLEEFGVDVKVGASVAETFFKHNDDIVALMGGFLHYILDSPLAFPDRRFHFPRDPVDHYVRRFRTLHCRRLN